MSNTNFFCNKRYDISFQDFYKLIQLILPSTITSREIRGIYKKEYQPCNVIELFNKTDDIQQTYSSTNYIASIYSWLGKRGLTVLADTDLTISLCREVLKEIKQNAEDYATYVFPLLDEQTIISSIDAQYRIFKQLNTLEGITKYIIKEYIGDEVNIEFYSKQNLTKLHGDTTSLMTYMTLLISKIIEQSNKNESN